MRPRVSMRVYEGPSIRYPFFSSTQKRVFLASADGYGQGMVKGGSGEGDGLGDRERGDEGRAIATREEASKVMMRGTHLTAVYPAFLDEFSRLNQRACPSVRPSVT